MINARNSITPLVVSLALALALAACSDSPQSTCQTSADCETGVCDAATQTCVDPTCNDGATNGDETDVDCGGGCGPCADAQQCAQNADCMSGRCMGGTCAPALCGDGVVGASEQCDDGGESATCDADCTLALCGDTVVNAAAGEICDDGGESPLCDADCTPVACGDGTLNASASEQCDDGGESAMCDADCTAAECGDGTRNQAAGEACDHAGESPWCDADCTDSACGDGTLNTSADELCDDGGESATCDLDCTPAICGDGTRNTTAGEACDTAGESSLCDPDCTLPACGDSYINTQAGEECDDGNASNNDDCVGACTLARCGDGFLRTGVEECDDGNSSNNDLCTNVCLAASCDDGFQNADETDVDCGGHCGLASCQAGQVCTGNEDCISDNCVGGLCQTPSSIAVGSAHTCAVLTTGAVKCWGYNAVGQLGYGHVLDIGDNELPSSVGTAGLGNAAAQIAMGVFHTCALSETGRVRCWGGNDFGQLGYGDTLPVGNNEQPSTAGDVAVGGSVIQIAAGGYHTCALLDNGAVKCWGDNSNGQLGYGNTDDIGDDELPSSVSTVTLGGSAVAIAAGGLHTCALMNTGAVRCWGLNNMGQLGYGDTDNVGDDEAPQVAGNVPVGAAAVAIAAGWAHTCALLATGDVKCWGDGSSGQLGYGNTNAIGDNELPSSVSTVGVGGNVVQLVAGIEHTCALLDTDRVRCWGNNTDGQLGYGNTNNIGDNELPQVAGDVAVGGLVTGLAAGLGYHTCASLSGTAVRCWGRSDRGQLGYGDTDTIGDDESPATAGNVPYL